ncbi:MAG: (d)CMP kinase [Bauldia sp.]|nr:(d)CMP kinase [Bauldia sp.]MCW5717519.1 (d)CMP kinase [Bauldia sp.]
MIIAIDGPAASGKGTLGKRLADHYGYHHLDTGLLYRAVAAQVLDEAGMVDDPESAIAAAQNLRIERLDPVQLGRPEIAEAASRVAAMPALRAALVAVQRAFAAKKPGVVLDGRDIGTVICPDAEVKIFLVADPEVRARRRAAQLGAHDAEAFARILDDIRRRDERDIHRAAAPLRQADDARLLDTTALDIEAAFRAAVDIVDERR